MWSLHSIPFPLCPVLLMGIVLSVSGCDDGDDDQTGTCTVTLDSVAPAAATPGETAIVSGSPFTTLYDSALYVGSSRATLLDLDRTGCESCDECRDDENCTACGDCDACDSVCDACVETLSFEVPEETVGTTALQLYNRYGHSASLSFEVTTNADTGASNPKSGDTAQGPTDTGDTKHNL